MVVLPDVRADEARDLGAADGHVEVVDGGEAAEVDAEVRDLEDRRLVDIALRNDVHGGDGDHLGVGMPLLVIHLPRLPSCRCPRTGRPRSSPWRKGG